ncbi:uncharacterized protein B0H18DRAFT_9992 [Fomitopsis serialis]|uniref:uncharacterized protein n=1 Tax=Fomitopsis serialis TaxID=139415 RepID=UPI0020078B35|nr:uncharacterized protein B0H18DRAFT_9992 [Neoantrodia serialis]KAH9938297.1 hypothetical protein B0H18DRAFT_9992 [Neoantrodia serialis]
MDRALRLQHPRSGLRSEGRRVFLACSIARSRSPHTLGLWNPRVCAATGLLISVVQDIVDGARLSLVVTLWSSGSLRSERPITPEVANSTAYAHVNNHIVWYAGRGQYSENGGGESACGLASLNCARIVLGLEQRRSRNGGPPDGDILDKMVQREITEEILRPCSSWSQTAHLSVTDIYKTPIFHKSLKLLHSSYGRCRLQEFKHVLVRLSQTTQTSGVSASAVITRPPEIISCMKPVTTTAGADTFVVYDSHPRPDHPDGAAFIVFKSMDDAASYLAQLLSFDESLLADDEAQWQVQYLAQFSAHIFAARQMPFASKELEDATLEASLDVLGLKARVSELECQNHDLLAEKAKLTNKVTLLEYEVVGLHAQNRRRPHDPFSRGYLLDDSVDGVWVESTPEPARRDAGWLRNILNVVGRDDSSSSASGFKSRTLMLLCLAENPV